MSRGPGLTQHDVNQVVALKASDPLMPDTQIAALIGRSRTTVTRLAERFGALIERYRELKSRDIIDDVDCVRRAHLAHAAEPATINKMSGLQAVTSFAILTDKMLLESGRPTSINLTATADITVPQVLTRLRRAIEMRAGTATTSSNDEAVE